LPAIENHTPADAFGISRRLASKSTSLAASQAWIEGWLSVRDARLNSRNPILSFEPWRDCLPLRQAQLVTAVAERTQLSKSDAKRALAALDEVVLDELGNAQKLWIGGLVQLTVRVKPAQKPRKGRNPATGEEITVAAKPASVDLRARPLARAKGALPSVQKARRRLAA
jgi:DNA-binding protein HU-beta